MHTSINSCYLDCRSRFFASSVLFSREAPGEDTASFNGSLSLPLSLDGSPALEESDPCSRRVLAPFPREGKVEVFISNLSLFLLFLLLCQGRASAGRRLVR